MIIQMRKQSDVLVTSILCFGCQVLELECTDRWKGISAKKGSKKRENQ